MKNLHYNIVAFLLVSLLLLPVVVACGKIEHERSTTESVTEMIIKEYYDLDDFEFIVVGKTTFSEVYKVVPIEHMMATSYGGLCEYPTKNGGRILIKFYGEELIVGSVEEVE